MGKKKNRGRRKINADMKINTRDASFLNSFANLEI